MAPSTIRTPLLVVGLLLLSAAAVALAPGSALAVPPSGLGVSNEVSATPAAHTGASGATSAIEPAATPVQHVVWVMLEDEPLSKIQKDNGYLWSLCSSYACDLHYYAVCHPSTGNYVALTSGQPLHCGTDGYSTYSVSNIGNLVTAKGLTWKAYAESMPSPCDVHSALPLYSIAHNPMIYYENVRSPASYCIAQDTGFPSSWSTAPNFLLVTPNLLHSGNLPGDGGEKGIQDSDAWLKTWLPMIQGQSWYSSAAIFILYDESANSDHTCPSGLTGGVSTTQCGGNPYLSVVSPFAVKKANPSTPTDEYDLLATTEWLLGLGNTGAKDAHGIAMQSMFTFGKAGAPNHLAAGDGSALSGTAFSFSSPLLAAEYLKVPASHELAGLPLLLTGPAIVFVIAGALTLRLDRKQSPPN